MSWDLRRSLIIRPALSAGSRLVNPSAEARYTASPVLGPRPAQNVQQNESSMSGSFSEKYFRDRRDHFRNDRHLHAEWSHGDDDIRAQHQCRQWWLGHYGRRARDELTDRH